MGRPAAASIAAPLRRRWASAPSASEVAASVVPSAKAPGRQLRSFVALMAILSLLAPLMVVTAEAARPSMEATRKRHRRRKTLVDYATRRGGAGPEDGEMYEDMLGPRQMDYQDSHMGHSHYPDEAEEELQGGEIFDNGHLADSDDDDEASERPADGMEAEAMEQHHQGYHHSAALMDTGRSGMRPTDEYNAEVQIQDGEGTLLNNEDTLPSKKEESQPRNEVSGGNGEATLPSRNEESQPNDLLDSQGDEPRDYAATISDGRIVLLKQNENPTAAIRQAEREENNGFSASDDGGSNGGWGGDEGDDGGDGSHRGSGGGGDESSQLSDFKSEDWNLKAHPNDTFFAGDTEDGVSHNGLQHYYGRTRDLAAHVNRTVKTLSQSLRKTMTTAETAATGARRYRDTLRNLSLGIKQFNEAAGEFRSRTHKRHMDKTNAIQAAIAR